MTTAVVEVPSEENIEQHFGLVAFTLKKFSQWDLQKADWDDLFQVGRLALLKAIRNYDAERETTFSSYAISFIHWDVWNYLRDLKRLRTSHIKVLSTDHPLCAKEISMLDTLSTDDDITTVQVKEFLNSLPNRERELVLYRVNGTTQEEIAERLGLSQAHISRLLKRIGKKYLAFTERG